MGSAPAGWRFWQPAAPPITPDCASDPSIIELVSRICSHVLSGLGMVVEQRQDTAQGSGEMIGTRRLPVCRHDLISSLRRLFLLLCLVRKDHCKFAMALVDSEVSPLAMTLPNKL
jgi:hypothetical protein